MSISVRRMYLTENDSSRVINVTSWNGLECIVFTVCSSTTKVFRISSVTV